jgi:hypothetical protein
VDLLAKHEISEAAHRILNPFTVEKLMLLGEVCRLQPAMRQLDLACGKGEMLCRWAAAFGIEGVGVDISTVFIPAAVQRAAELGVAERVKFVRADASTYAAEPEAFDVVSCIGATWIGGGLTGTIELLRPPLRPGGLLVVGEPFWKEPPPAEALDREISTDDFTSLEGTLNRFESTGAELVEMVLADDDSWDRYACGQWWSTADWLRANPGHEDAGEMRQFLEEGRRSYLRYGRRYLGWGVFVLRMG